MPDLRRRQFITLLGGAAVAWPLAARAQQAAMPVMGYLSAASPESVSHRMAVFHEGLAQTGYLEGQNVAIEYRWAEGHYGRLPEMAEELGAPSGSSDRRNYHPCGARGKGRDRDNSNRVQRWDGSG